MKSLVLLPSLLLLAAPLRAQASCAAGDSVAGPEVHANRYHRAYDRMTDTTRLEVRKQAVHLISSSQDATFALQTAFEGQTPHAPPAATLLVSTTSERKGGSSQTASRELNHMAEAETALLLVDGSTRMQLPRVTYGDRVRQQNLLSNDRLVENAVFALNADQLRTIATATQKVEIAVGMARGSLGHGEIDAAKELYRVLACAPASGAAH